jgi:subtilisin family serine protease
VDIWAPTRMLSTTTPDSIAADNNVDNFGTDELYSFGGTSASTPFIAGTIGLMKTANPNLSYEQVLSILQSTANSSPDPLVAKGYVDVYRAVRGLIVNQPPVVKITNHTKTIC